MPDDKKAPVQKNEDPELKEILENLDFLMSYEVLEEEENWDTVEALDNE